MDISESEVRANKATHTDEGGGPLQQSKKQTADLKAELFALQTKALSMQEVPVGSELSQYQSHTNCHIIFKLVEKDVTTVNFYTGFLILCYFLSFHPF